MYLVNCEDIVRIPHWFVIETNKNIWTTWNYKMKACLPLSSIRLTVTTVKIDHRGLIPSGQNSLSVSVRHLQVQELMGSSCLENLAVGLSSFCTPD